MTAVVLLSCDAVYMEGILSSETLVTTYNPEDHNGHQAHRLYVRFIISGSWYASSIGTLLQFLRQDSVVAAYISARNKGLVTIYLCPFYYV